MPPPEQVVCALSISAAKRQSMVNERYLNRVNGWLIGRRDEIRDGGAGVGAHDGPGRIAAQLLNSATMSAVPPGRAAQPAIARIQIVSG
jgi:hypothetical protein